MDGIYYITPPIFSHACIKGDMNHLHSVNSICGNDDFLYFQGNGSWNPLIKYRLLVKARYCGDLHTEGEARGM